MDVPAFSPPAVFATESMKRSSFLTYFTKVLLQLIYGYDVEQDKYSVINMRNLKIKVTKMLHIASYSI